VSPRARDYSADKPRKLDIVLPKYRITAANACPWLYWGPDCSYTGVPKADEFGNTLTIGTDRGAYNSATTYALHDYVYTVVNGIRKYYVSQKNSNTGALTDPQSWTHDACSKQIQNGCRLRFPSPTPMPTAAFPGTMRLPKVA